MKTEVKYCPADNNYYLQCILESRSFRRRLRETNRQLSRETDPEARARLRARLEDLAVERSYMTDYLLLRREEVPAGILARRLPKRPQKLVTVDDNTRRWLFSHTPGLNRTSPAASAAPTGNCYDFPTE